jgi:hypothetical protein
MSGPPRLNSKDDIENNYMIGETNKSGYLLLLINYCINGELNKFGYGIQMEKQL